MLGMLASVRPGIWPCSITRVHAQLGYGLREFNKTTVTCTHELRAFNFRRNKPAITVHESHAKLRQTWTEMSLMHASRHAHEVASSRGSSRQDDTIDRSQDCMTHDAHVSKDPRCTPDVHLILNLARSYALDLVS